MATSWTDRVVAERMTVDQAFAERIVESRFSSQEWSLIMTATEFEIVHPDDPDEARIVANTEKIEHVLPELEAVRTPFDTDGSRGTGIIHRFKRVFGLVDGDGYEEEREAAKRLTAEYASELQAHLESTGRWRDVRRLAADGSRQRDRA